MIGTMEYMTRNQQNQNATQRLDAVAQKLIDFHNHMFNQQVMAQQRNMAVNFNNIRSQGYAVAVRELSSAALEIMIRASTKKALEKMNHIAREKYEPLIDLMGIEVDVDFTTSYYRDDNLWRLSIRAKVTNKLVQVAWRTPNDDPGTKLSVWDHMFKRLLQKLERANGHDSHVP